MDASCYKTIVVLLIKILDLMSCLQLQQTAYNFNRLIKKYNTFNFQTTYQWTDRKTFYGNIAWLFDLPGK